MRCENCNNNPATCSAILGGVYVKNVCSTCKIANVRVSSGHARWQRGTDIEDREADIQQPHNSDGTINTRFARLYPQQAKALFTTEELRNAER